MHIILSRLQAVVIFFGMVEGRARFAIANLRAVSREKNNDCSQSKFCQNIVYVSSIARDFPFHLVVVVAVVVVVDFI